MNSLLDQAIVDANALKEAALKNAQQKVLDMYSSEVKKAVDTLLEEKKEERDPLMPDRNGLMTSPELEVKVSKAIKPANVASQPFGDLKDTFKMGDDERISISFTALEEALNLEGDDMLDEDFLAPGDFDQNEQEEADANPDKQFDHTASNYGEMEEMSGSDMLGSEQGAGYVGGSDYMEEGEELSLDEMEMEEMYSIGSENINPDSDSLMELDMDESMSGYGVEPDMMKEEEEYELEEGELEEELYGTDENLADPLDEESDSLYGNDREDLDEVLILDMELSNQGHLGFNPVHYKEQQRIANALEVHKAEAEKSKKKEKKLQETVTRLQFGLEELTEAYTDLKSQFETLTVDNSKQAKVISVYQQSNKKLTETVNAMLISNAKLLYTSKVLGNDSLNERQKQGLVENISKADTVERAKIIYETLQSGVQVKERRSPKSLSEAVNRSPSHYAQQKVALNENIEVEQLERMQLLAGIKK